MASFAQKFASKKQASGGNSIQEEIILESMKQATEDLAAQVSQETSSVGNVESILARGSKSLAPDTKSAEEALLEQELEENSLEKLLKAIELATTPEELSTLMQQYEELLASWSERSSLLRSEKHLKEYLSIVAALSMLQKMMQNPDLLLSGKKISEMLQTNLKSQQQNINEQAQKMQVQNQKLHEQTQALTKQLSQTERSLQASIEALKKDPGKLSQQELQATLKQLQESLKQVQELKEKTVPGKPLDFKEMQDGLQKIHAQNQKLIESGKISETALQAMRQSQQSLQQTLQQTNVVQQLQKNVSALQTAQVQQINQNASQLMQAQISTLTTDKINTQSQKLQEQEKLLPKQLSTAEQSLKSAIEALQKDPGKFSQKEQQESLKQLQESLKKIQELKEKQENGKPLDSKELLESLQKINAQNQKLLESGKLSETALNAMRQSQQSLQQTLQQTKSIQQLQENIGKLQNAQATQVKQNNALTTDKINTQSQKLQEQEKLLPKQLSTAEQSLKSAIEALQKDPGKFSQKEQQESLKQLQESLKKVQELKEGKDGKQATPKEILESLQKINAQKQNLVESGKLSENALNAMRQSQQSLQQTLEQSKLAQQLQENVGRLKATLEAQNVTQARQTQASMLPKDAMLSQMLSPEARGQVPLQQRQPSLMETLPLPTRVMAEASGQRAALEQVVAKQNAVSFTTSQALESARIAGTAQVVQSSAQTAVMTGQVIEAARHSNVVQQQAAVVANNTVQQAHVAEQAVIRVQSVPDNVVQITSATQQQARQEHIAASQAQTPDTPKDTQAYEERRAKFAESFRKESFASADVLESSRRVCKCSSHVQRAEQIKSNAMIVGF